MQHALVAIPHPPSLAYRLGWVLWVPAIALVAAGGCSAWEHLRLSAEGRRLAAEERQLAEARVVARSVASAPFSQWMSQRPEGIGHRTFSQRLERACAQQGVRLESLAWASSTSQAHTGLERYALSATMRGTYSQLVQVVATMLDDHPAQLALSKLGLRRLAGSAEVEAQVEWVMWTRPRAGALPGVAAR